jgi:RNA polymerase sigma factor (sigma-70 family)
MAPGLPRTEIELFEAVGQGDTMALKEYQSRIERCVRFRMGRAGEIEIQEVCDRIGEKLEGLRRRGFSGNNQAFRVYLYRVVASQVVEVRRERAALVSLDAPVELPDGGSKTLGELANEMIEPHWNVLKEMAAQQEASWLRDALEGLDGRCRQLLLHREVERLPEQEIADRLQMTLSNVWASLHRCKERLYRRLLAMWAGEDSLWKPKVSHLAEKLMEPLATIFRLWWDENRTIREMDQQLRREERDVKELLARAKAGVWQLAQETGAE